MKQACRRRITGDRLPILPLCTGSGAEQKDDYHKA